MQFRLKDAPIGVFDSGVGGLTVLRALRAALPREDFLYLGDTARLPYGTKSRDSVVQYALQASSLLVERGKGDTEEWARLRRRELRLTWLNVVLGVLVLAFSAWAGAL